MQRVLETNSGNVYQATWRKNYIRQLWWFDQVSKTIKSEQWKDRGLAKSGANLVVQVTNSRWWQLWKYEEPYLVGEKGQVIKVSGAHDSNHRNIEVQNKAKGWEYEFDIVYEKDWIEDPKKGELNKDFGLYVDRTFFIVSGLKSGRYIDYLGRNMVIKTQNGRKSQEFYFHQQSRTIRSRQHNWSFDIQSSGRSSNMHLWSTNSGWWQIFKYDGTYFTNIQNKKVLDVAGGRDKEANNV